jgi:hypothetical protein
LAEEFHARNHLAHRNCMQPDGPRTCLSKWTWQESETLWQGVPIGAVSQTANQEIQ